MPRITHRLESAQIRLGLVMLERLCPTAADLQLDHALRQLIAEYRESLPPEVEARRLRSRNMLRLGSYKPTGRGKPANEYLLRAARQDCFPRVNSAVDALNLISLRYMVPISLWDLTASRVDTVEIRLGRADESYVFNASGQQLALRDLVCGCSVTQVGSTPMVSPIKDSMSAKLSAGGAEQALAIVYFPGFDGDPVSPQRIASELAQWLGNYSDPVRCQHLVLDLGKAVVL